MELELIRLDAAEMPKEAPAEVRVLPLGEVKSTKGDFVVDDESFRLMKEHMERRGLDLVVDYEHQTLSGEQAPAAGWIRELKLGEDAILAETTWTGKAAEYIRNLEYRYMSPVIAIRKTDRKAVMLHSVALTNTPAVDHFPVIAMKDPTDPERNEKMIKKLIESLGLPEDATEADVMTAVEALKADAQAAANSTVLEMLELSAGARTEDVAAAIASLKNASEAQVELAALKAEVAEKKAQDAVEAALKEGKITAAQKEWALSYARKDLDGFAQFVLKAPQAVQMDRVSDPEGTEQKDGMDDLNRDVFAAMGLSEEDVRKYGGVD